MPLEAPWKGSRCERAGATWKEIFNRAVKEMQLNGFDDARVASRGAVGMRPTNGYWARLRFDYLVLFWYLVNENDLRSWKPPRTRTVRWPEALASEKQRE